MAGDRSAALFGVPGELDGHGYNYDKGDGNTATFRNAFHCWYGQSPGEYRTSIKAAAELSVAAFDQ
jgi:hypothetical protein